MNHISNSKIAQINNNIGEIDRVIQEQIFSLQDEEIRKLVDERRQLSSLLISMQEANEKQSLPTKWYNTNPDVERLLDDWVEKVKKNGCISLDFKDDKFCNDFVDLALPRTWHFENDVIVIADPPSAKIVENIINRGQRHIVVLADFTETSELKQKLSDAEYVQFCTDLGSVERTFATLQAAANQVIIIPCRTDASTESISKDDITTAINAGKKTRFENTRTVSKFGESWALNVIHNLPSLADAKNMHELNVTNVEDAVVVASGPSLNRNVHVLNEIQDAVFIVAALRSLSVLNDAGVIPDLVVQLDAEDDEVAKQLALDEKLKVNNFLFEPTINPGFQKIPRKQTIWSLGQHFFDIHNSLGTKPTPFNVPSVSIYSLSLCHMLGFNNVCFVGQDLAASGEKQYADGATNILPAHSQISMFNIEVPGFNGKPVMTRNSFEYQIRRCTEIAVEWKIDNPLINLVNATEGGAFIDGFDHMTLAEFAKSRNLSGRQRTKAISFNAQTQITNLEIENFLVELSNTMDKMINISNMIIKLDQQTRRTKGLEKKIQKTVQKFRKLNNECSLVQIAMQDNIARVIGTSNSAQHVDSYAEFFQKIRKNAIAIKLAAKKSTRCTSLVADAR